MHLINKIDLKEMMETARARRRSSPEHIFRVANRQRIRRTSYDQPRSSAPKPFAVSSYGYPSYDSRRNTSKLDGYETHYKFIDSDFRPGISGVMGIRSHLDVRRSFWGHERLEEPAMYHRYVRKRIPRQDHAWSGAAGTKIPSIVTGEE